MLILLTFTGVFLHKCPDTTVGPQVAKSLYSERVRQQNNITEKVVSIRMDTTNDAVHADQRETGYSRPRYLRNLLPTSISWRLLQRELVPALKTAWTDTVHIARSVWRQWRAILTNLFASCLIAGLAMCIYELAISLPASQDVQYCVPGGDFNLYHKYNPFSLSHAFQITLSFGRFTFSPG